MILPTRIGGHGGGGGQIRQQFRDKQGTVVIFREFLGEIKRCGGHGRPRLCGGGGGGGGIHGGDKEAMFSTRKHVHW